MPEIFAFAFSPSDYDILAGAVKGDATIFRRTLEFLPLGNRVVLVRLVSRRLALNCKLRRLGNNVIELTPSDGLSRLCSRFVN